MGVGFCLVLGCCGPGWQWGYGWVALTQGGGSWKLCVLVNGCCCICCSLMIDLPPAPTHPPPHQASRTVGWNMCLEITLSSAAVARGFASYLATLFGLEPGALRLGLGPVQLDPAAALLILALTALLITGTEASSRFNMGGWVGGVRVAGMWRWAECVDVGDGVWLHVGLVPGLAAQHLLARQSLQTHRPTTHRPPTIPRIHPLHTPLPPQWCRA